MYKQVFLTTLLICSLCRGYAQKTESTLNDWSSQSPIEKVYLHFDRQNYVAGQTIWFKAYLYSDFLPDDESSTLFVELLGPGSSIISRQVIPVFGGFSRGQIQLPDTLPAGTYTCRAYTITMLNHDPGFLFKRLISITGKRKATRALPAMQKPSVRLEFFPEGGSLIKGLPNSVAFKATDEKGLPVNVRGTVQNDKGERLAGFSSYHDGMGYFDLAIDEKSTYYAVLQNDSPAKRYELPAATSKGVILRVISSGATRLYEILQRDDDPVFKAAYMIGQMQHHTVFRKDFNKAVNEMTGMIQTANLSSGILHITVFNSYGQPLAERLTFVNNREYVQQGDLNWDTLNFTDRGRNHFFLNLPDTVTGSFSLSVSDAAFENGERQQTIISGLLLTSDLNGYIHNPSYYFSSSSDSVQNALDLVMMTNGWRRFKWNEILREPPAIRFTDPGYITISGTVTLQGTKKPFADRDLFVFVLANDSSRNMLMLHTDAAGQFRVDSLVFFGPARILFADVKGRKSRYIDIKPGNDSLHKVYKLPELIITDGPAGPVLPGARERLWQEEYDEMLKAGGLMLEGVTVKGRKKTPLEELEEKYVSPLFSGNANSTLNLIGENLVPYQNIFDYLQMRVPGLQISRGTMDTGYTVQHRQMGSISSLGEIPMTIFLDEIPSDADVIASIPASDIALVKVFSSFTGAMGNAPGGVLAIYTKKDTDRKTTSTGAVINANGYSVIKEFYSPDYSVDTLDQRADHRITLYWNSAIWIDGINPAIPFSFFNNDRARQFKVVVEGMTVDGKLLMIEKIITDNRKAF